MQARMCHARRGLLLRGSPLALLGGGWVRAHLDLNCCWNEYRKSPPQKTAVGRPSSVLRRCGRERMGVRHAVRWPPVSSPRQARPKTKAGSPARAPRGEPNRAGTGAAVTHLGVRQRVRRAVDHYQHVPALALRHRAAQHCIHHRPQSQACTAGRARVEGQTVGISPSRTRGGSCGGTAAGAPSTHQQRQAVGTHPGAGR